MASSLSFLPDQVEWGCGPNAVRWPPPFSRLFRQHGTNQHFYSHPAERQPTPGETEGDLVRWRCRVCEHGKEKEKKKKKKEKEEEARETEIEAANEGKQEGRILVRVLNLTRC